MITVYGIKNCDTMKKAFAWLNEHNIAYRFHDYKKDGITAERVKAWVKELGWENLVNKRGTTWRGLADNVKNSLEEASAITLMCEKPSVIKRPLVDTGHKRFCGFSASEFEQELM